MVVCNGQSGGGDAPGGLTGERGARHDVLDHLRVGRARDAAVALDVRRDALEGHDGDRAGLLGDARLPAIGGDQRGHGEGAARRSGRRRRRVVGVDGRASSRACSPLTTSMMTPPCWKTAKARLTAVSTSASLAGRGLHGARVVGAGGASAVVALMPATWNHRAGCRGAEGGDVGRGGGRRPRGDAGAAMTNKVGVARRRAPAVAGQGGRGGPYRALAPGGDGPRSGSTAATSRPKRSQGGSTSRASYPGAPPPPWSRPRPGRWPAPRRPRRPSPPAARG